MQSRERPPSGEGEPIPIERGAYIKFEKHNTRLFEASERIAGLLDRLEAAYDEKSALLKREEGKPFDSQNPELINLLNKDLDELEREGNALVALLEEIGEHQEELIRRLGIDERDKTP